MKVGDRDAGLDSENTGNEYFVLRYATLSICHETKEAEQTTLKILKRLSNM